MKSKILLTEEELVDLIDTILENSNLNQYHEEDFFDVYLEVFKPWAKQKYGKDIFKKYPLSKLITQKWDDFREAHQLEDESYNWMNLGRKMAHIGRKLVEKGLFELPSEQPTELFTKKYEKILNYIVQSLELPPGVKVYFSEEEPYRVYVDIKFDWPELIKSGEDVRPKRAQHIFDNISKLISNYMGIETNGKPIYGELDMDLRIMPMTGVDEWAKEVLNKVVKKKFRETPLAVAVHSISFKGDASSGTGILKIRMKSTAAWNKRGPVKDEIKKILSELGYNTKFFDIDT